MNIFVGVNYKSNNVLQRWLDSISRVSKDHEVLIVDNFSTMAERKAVQAFCSTNKCKIIESENIGYGAALNLALSYIKTNCAIEKADFILFGNVDIEFQELSLPKIKYGESIAIFPKVVEEKGNRIRNIFLTKIQSYFLFLYWPAAIFKSIFLHLMAVVCLKCLAIIPSSPFTCHGSLFVLSASIVNRKSNIFDNEVFLYCEELSFGSFLLNQKIPISTSGCLITHIGNVSTKEIYISRKSYVNVWSQSFIRWFKDDFLRR